ncbi:hypothetical protein P152DRAFT_402462 [Eremomyces bilateralis CBS 781.70]|uniref:Alpha N-terminal protein methyltransferase 1 n=1 Tax=Eremomyces bilateralis CBS 781.70 TaxID=1392243 RepID=A0A6G1FW92_9PEZI|nr:uncharacterized protein P152DRAFT_402462 [Eremomyces bilateralis CBS 781.70]KAF1809962.1 hypothetical protein P152DRAFT_402462 [Eremomyces bilateralis CBS 781.70]
MKRKRQENVDHQISKPNALAYWASVSADDDGVLGGFPEVSPIDIAGSRAFLTELMLGKPPTSNQEIASNDPGDEILFDRVVDCGAGIGRVTRNLLSQVARTVDIVEPVKELTDVVTASDSFKDLRDAGRIGDVFNVGLQDWVPPEGRRYDLVWTQWCLGQLTDKEVVRYLKKLTGSQAGDGYLTRNSGKGWLVVKENIITPQADGKEQDRFDKVDSSVTRTEGKFNKLFRQAGLEVVQEEKQSGLPEGLFPVMMWALMRVW